MRAIRALVACLLAGLTLFACSSGTGPGADPTTTEPGPSRLLALGDSYTIGEGVLEAQRWPEQLAARLRDEGRVEVSVEIVARTGWTTSDLDAGIDTADPEGPYDLVTLLIGVNNQFRGLDLEAYRGEFDGLLQRAIGLAGDDPARVLVVSIPDWGATPFGSTRSPERIGGEIDAFNMAAREVADSVGVAWVDVTDISRDDDPGLVAFDGLHPSGTQYALWVDRMLPAVRHALES
jgi:lysophospholipase L1-like esterase